MMKIFNKTGFFSALSFLSIIRPASTRFDGRLAVYHFSYIGLIIGLGAYLLSFLFSGAPHVINAVIILIYLTVITGALHLDGLADTADGLFSGRPKERMLEIMKDSRLGSMGAVALILLFLAKFSGLLYLESAAYLILIPAYARVSMVFGVYFLNYARQDGTAKDFFGRFDSDVFIQYGILLVLSFIMIDGAVLFNIIYLIFTALIIKFYKSRMDGITGDMLGGMCETMEAFLLILAVVL